MRVRKYLPLVAALAAACLSCQSKAQPPEQLIAGIQYIDAATGTVTGFAADYLHPEKADLTVRICFDSPTENCAQTTASQSGPNKAYCIQSLCHNFSYVIPDGEVGAVRPKDGAAHLVYASAVSPGNPGAGDAAAIGSPFPFIWNETAAGPLYPPPPVGNPPSKLTPSQMGVLVNSDDAYSIGTLGDVCPDAAQPLGSDGTAGYYVRARQIPCSNVFVVSVPVTRDMQEDVFRAKLLPALEAIPAGIQAMAIAWVMPSRVVPKVAGGNYSQGMTSVVALRGLVEPTAVVTPAGVCLVDSKTDSNPYFNSTSAAPFTDFGLRPAMMLAAQSCDRCDPGKPDWAPDFNRAKALIDRGLAADSTMPYGSVFVMRTSDMSRNLRSWTFSPRDAFEGALSPYVSAEVVGADVLDNRTNVLYYAQGTANQKSSNVEWAPGGVGDSLTSSSGLLPASGNQTPITWWLEQGAVGSYGTVSEPCDGIRKFPDPAVFTRHYGAGSTLVEAYWKSVKKPFQGNFVGDPLVAPYFPPHGDAEAPIRKKKARSQLKPSQPRR